MMLRRNRGPRPAKLPDAMIFDALGTLIQMKPPVPIFCQEFRSRFAIPITTAQADRAIAEQIVYHRKHAVADANMAELVEQRRRSVRAMLPHLPPQAQTIPLDDLTEALQASIKFRVFPDVGFALGGARTRGSKMIVVSNWDSSLRQVMDELELTPLLDGLVISAEVGAGKPDPEIFHFALEVAGVPARKAMHIGDSVEEDVAGAKAAGIKPVLLSRDGEPGPAGVRTIQSLIELIAN